MKYLAFRLRHVIMPDNFNHFEVDWDDAWVVNDPANPFGWEGRDQALGVSKRAGCCYVLWAQDREYMAAFTGDAFEMTAYLKRKRPDFLLAMSDECGALMLHDDLVHDIKDLELGDG